MITQSLQSYIRFYIIASVLEHAQFTVLLKTIKIDEFMITEVILFDGISAPEVTETEKQSCELMKCVTTLYSKILSNYFQLTFVSRNFFT